MNKGLLIRGGFAILFVSLTAACIAYPNLAVNEKTRLLTEFVGSYFLPFLGIVVTVTLSSVTKLHLEVNRLEYQKKRHFPQTKKSIRRSGYSLVISLFIGFLLVIAAPFIDHDPMWLSLLSVWAMLIILFNILILWDLTKAILTIPSNLEAGDTNHVS